MKETLVLLGIVPICTLLVCITIYKIYRLRQEVDLVKGGFVQHVVTLRSQEKDFVTSEDILVWKKGDNGN